MANIIIVGLMGVGKSTIGRQLATEIAFEFFDSDTELERKTGANIPWIFDLEGESGFRKRESEMLELLCRKSGIVLATGGGAILNSANRRLLKQSGKVIYLQASVNQLVERTRLSKNRPLLRSNDPRKTLQALLLQREPLYLEIADHVIRTDNRSPASVVKEIVEQL